MLSFEIKFPRLLAVSLLLTLWSAAASAASVKGVSSKKGQVSVSLDGMKTTKGAVLCIFSGKKKIDCGSVVSIKAGVAYVSVENKKNLKRIKKGMTVTPESGDSAATADKGSSSSTKIWLSWAPGIVTPAVYNMIGYTAPEAEGASESLWESDGVASQTLMGFGLQVGIPVGRMAIVPGLRYRTFGANQVDADYIYKKAGDPYVETITAATALGVFADFAFLSIPFGSVMDLYGTGGLDIDMSTVTVKAEKLHGTDPAQTGPIASATSNLTVVSLRVGGGLNLIPVKPFGISAGLNILVPLVELGKKFSGSLEENEGRGVPEPGEDLKTKLGHKKNGFGLDVQASVLLAF
jgi:hypothetical protein